MAVSALFPSLADESATSITTWALVALCSIAALLRFRHAMVKTPRIPLVGANGKDAKQRTAGYTFNAKSIIQEGHRQFKDKIFGVATAGGLKIEFPLRYIEEVGNKPGLSFPRTLDQDLLIDYTYMGGLKEFALTTFKREINPKLQSFIPLFTDLIEEQISNTFGNGTSWEPVNMYPSMLRMLGVLTARVMVGDEAPHNQTWVTLTTDFVQSGVAYGHALKLWPSYLRPLICRFLPQHSEVQGQLNDGRKILIDAIRKIREREENGVPEPQPASVLYHMSRKAPGTSSRVIDMHLKEQMNLAVGAIHTTSSVLTQTIFELAAHTDYIPELRKEAIDTLAKFDGVFSKAALSEMHKLDSFIQEAHRLNSPNLTAVQRLAIQDVTLSDGIFLPKGTKLEFPAYAFHLDEELHKNAAQFDGFRFFRKRQEDGEGAGGKYHYVSVRKDVLGWGYGKNACPGRFMADIEIKLVVAFVLMNYDLKNPDGQGRHQNVHFENQVFPAADPILVRKIRREDIGPDGRVMEM